MNTNTIRRSGGTPIIVAGIAAILALSTAYFVNSTARAPSRGLTASGVTPVVRHSARGGGLSLAYFMLGATQPSKQIRLTPREIAALESIGATAGTSGVSGIETRVLKGDPTKTGLYTIELKVPANTRIEAHTHPDDRVATVVSGTWNFGYGKKFDPRGLKALPPGSFYTEPANAPHFAQTGSVAVVVHISGVGPTGTHYVESDHAKPQQMSLSTMATPTNPASIRSVVPRRFADHYKEQTHVKSTTPRSV